MFNPRGGIRTKIIVLRGNSITSTGAKFYCEARVTAFMISWWFGVPRWPFLLVSVANHFKWLNGLPALSNKLSCPYATRTWDHSGYIYFAECGLEWPSREVSPNLARQHVRFWWCLNSKPPQRFAGRSISPKTLICSTAVSFVLKLEADHVLLQL